MSRLSSARWPSPFWGSPLLYFLTFDFDPIHSAQPTERNRFQRCLIWEVTRERVPIPSTSSAQFGARRLRQPQRNCESWRRFCRLQTLLTFIPQDQDKKLELIQDFERQVEPALESPGQPSRQPMRKTSPLSIAWLINSTKWPATPEVPVPMQPNVCPAMR